MLLDVTTALAGLGLFFLGARTLGDALKRLAGRRVRVAVARSTDGPLKAAGMGLVSEKCCSSIDAFSMRTTCSGSMGS